MTPNPILKVLSTIEKHQVRFLLMGGQACVLYGAAEFSRDTDIVVVSDLENLRRLENALLELEADQVAVPPLSREYLDRGHAAHFRCRCEEARGIRIDIMSVLRGVAEFETLWGRRTTLVLSCGQSLNLLSLPDLVAAKKTARDKDWPMVRRLVEVNYFGHRSQPTAAQVEFWLLELRTASLLIEVAAHHRDDAKHLTSQRALLLHAIAGDESAVSRTLAMEEHQERQLDLEYWRPLKAELERLRHGRRR